MDYTADVWGEEKRDENSDIRDWLKSFYSGKQDIEDIKITPELKDRYNRFITESAKNYVAESAPNESNLGTLGQSVLQNTTQAGLKLADLIQRSGQVLNPYLMNPAQEALRQQRSQELGYGIAGAKELEKENGLPPGLVQKIVAAASQMAVDIPAKYANPAWAGVMVAEGALGGLDKGRTAEDIANQIEAGGGGTIPQDTRSAGETIGDVLKGAGSGAISAAALKGLGAVGKLAPGYARPLVEGGGFAAMSAVPATISGEKLDINDIVSSAIIGGFFGFKKRGEPRKTLGDFKDYVTSKLGRKLTLDENIAVSSAGMDAIEAMRPAKDKAAELAELQKQAEIEFREKGASKPVKLEQPEPPRVIGQGNADVAPEPTVKQAKAAEIKASGGGAEPQSDVIELTRYSRSPNRTLDKRPTSFFVGESEGNAVDSPDALQNIFAKRNKYTYTVPKDKIYSGGNKEIDNIINKTLDFSQDTNKWSRDQWMPNEVNLAEKLESAGYLGFQYPESHKLSGEVVVLDPTKITPKLTRDISHGGVGERGASAEELARAEAATGKRIFGKAAGNAQDFSTYSVKVDRNYKNNEFGFEAILGKDGKYKVTVDDSRGVPSRITDQRIREIENDLNSKLKENAGEITTSETFGEEFKTGKFKEKQGVDKLKLEATKYKTSEEFRSAHQAKDLMDLSNPEKHRWGRLFEDGVDESTNRYMDVKYVSDIYGVRGNNEFKYQKEAMVPDVKSADEMVTIYRGTQKTQKEILPGDFVSFNREYASGHSLHPIDAKFDGHTISLRVPAKDVVWQGNDFNEWIYSPEKIRGGNSYGGGLKKIWEDANKSQLIKLADMAAQKPVAETEVPPPAEPPAPSGIAKPYEPVMKESGPAKDVWKKAVEDGLADPESPWEIAKYESANKKEFAARTVDYIGDNIERGWEVIEGKTQPPPGTSVSSFFLAMRDYVNKSGNGEILNRFAKAKGLAQISEAASKLGQLSGYKQEETPVDARLSVEKTRKKHIEQIKENPHLETVLEKRLLMAQDRLAEAMARHKKDIERLTQIWHRKRLDQYAKRLGKKELTLTEKIKAGDFTKDPQYKIWLDKKTKTLRNNVAQLQRTFNKLKDLSDRRKFGMSDEEAQKLMNLYGDMKQKQDDIAAGRDRMVYGRSYVDYHEYIDALKSRAVTLTPGEALRMPVKMASKIAGISKAIKASFDNSYIFRQGFKTMWSHPKIWLDNSLKSFKWAIQQYGGKHVMRELMADIVSRPNYINGKMNVAKLAFGNPEEPFPTSLPEKWPGIGRIYKASETAFAGQAYKNRADIFDKFMDVEVGGKKMVDVADKKQLESIGKLVNSLTGRGHIGKTTKEQAEHINNLFFSLRFLKSNVDFLTAHQFQKGVTPFVRKEAAKNLIKATVGTAFVLGIANALKPGSVEWDTRSADFGKIRIGNTRFDVTGGMSSLVILASRLISGKTKSSVSGKITEGRGVFGDPTDYIYNFIEGKFSPMASAIWSLMKRKDYRTRKPPTAWDFTRRTLMPLPFENMEELLKDPNSADFLVSMIADGLGIGVNTYGPVDKSSANTRPIGGFDYRIK